MAMDSLLASLWPGPAPAPAEEEKVFSYWDAPTEKAAAPAAPAVDIDVYDEAQNAVGADDWEIWHNKGLCYMYLKQFDESVERVELARPYGLDDGWVVPHNLFVAAFSPSTINVLPFDPDFGADQARILWPAPA